jgi:hypothetical protein
MQTAANPVSPALTLLWIAGAAFAAGFLGYLAVGLNGLPG